MAVTTLAEDVIVSDEYWPLLTCYFPDRPLSDDAWALLLGHFKGIAERGQLHVLLVHADGPRHVPNAQQRALISKSIPEAALSTSLGTVVVAPSSIQRGVATAVSWLFKTRLNLYFVVSLEEGKQKAGALLEAAGLDCPPLDGYQPKR